MPLAWDNDHPSDERALARNVTDILRRIVADAADRTQPSVAMAQQWHRNLYRGIELPVTYYAGEIRDSDPQFPERFGYEVRVGEHTGAASRDVPAEVASFETALKRSLWSMSASSIMISPARVPSCT